MKAQYQQFVEDLTQRFAVLSALIEDHIFAQMLVSGDTFCTCHFDIDVPTICGLVHAFQIDKCLWADFQAAVQAHRKSTHWHTLLEHVYVVGSLMGKLRFLDHSLSCPSPNDRRLVAERLNSLDGEIAYCQDLADRRDLAKRVTRAIGFPLIDGLTLRGFTYVLAEHPALLFALRALVGHSAGAISVSHANKEVRQ
jgi:hypothetical protein